MVDIDISIQIREKFNSIKKTLSIAESCTGGMVSKRVTDVPGSSQFFNGAVIAYSDAVKIKILNVEEGLLKQYGAVSEQTALAMARGVKENIKSDIGASCTGIAGPGGSTPLKPVGMVCMAVCDDHVQTVETKYFSGDREEVRNAASNHLMRMILDFIGGPA